MSRWRWCLLLLLVAGGASAQTPPAVDTIRVLPDTTQIQVIDLVDGSRIIGRVTEATADKVTVVGIAGTVTIERSKIKTVHERPATSIRAGVYWFDDPNYTRLFFAPTGHMHKRGEGYFCDVWVVFVCITGGVTDRFTLGGGTLLLPTIENNLLYVTPKIGVVASEKVNLAVGALAGVWGLGFNEDDDETATFGIMYGVGTYGGRDNNVTLGVGWGFAEGDVDRNAMLMVGFKRRLGRSVSFLSENYFYKGEVRNGVVSYGLRFFGERLGVDLMLARPLDADGAGIGFPMLGFAYRLGKR
jgi:hypothetical protein